MTLPKYNAIGMPINWYGLGDGNSFYCSCEASVKPWLRERPIVVCSNNDGVLIALNRKAKALGFKMGDVYYKNKEQLRQAGVEKFSSNYELYGDISSKMHSGFASFVSEYELYSVDEGFLFLSGMEYDDFHSVGRQIIRTTDKGLGIPICLGIAQTKTLAKAVNKLAKSDPDRKGLYIIATEQERFDALKKLPIGDVWGIGRQYEKKLQAYGVQTAYDFASLSASLVRKIMGVTGERTHKELNGIECITLELTPPDKKEICTSRAFGQTTTDYDEVRGAVIRYLSSCARKLRRQNSYAQSLYVAIITNTFNKNQPQYVRGLEVRFPVPTNLTSEMIPFAVSALQKIWPRYRPGDQKYSFKKAVVTLTGLIPAESVSLNMFYDPLPDRPKRERLQRAQDAINGERKLDGRLLLYGVEMAKGDNTKLKRDMKSPCPTTKWNDRIEIDCP